MGVDRILTQAVHDAVEVADSAPVMLFRSGTPCSGSCRFLGCSVGVRGTMRSKANAGLSESGKGYLQPGFGVKWHHAKSELHIICQVLLYRIP